MPYKYVSGCKYICTLTQENTHISESFRATSKHEMRLVIEELRTWFANNPELAVNKRTIKGQVREWAAHNLLYDFGIEKGRTKSVDLNYPTKWYESVGYFILSLFY